MSDSIFETFPSFSPDGKWLYFCSATHKKMPEEFNKVKYNLCRIGFNPENGTFGDKIDTLFNAVALNKSVTFPRPSPDGKYLMFTLIDYGNFSIWHKEADLYLLDLQNGICRPITEVNSDNTDSYHSWSTNSRWFVFSSRRLDGLYTRPFIAHINEKGVVGKPFLLPQSTTDFYPDLMESFNIPEFITDKVDIDPNTVENLVAGEKAKQVDPLKMQ
jgi:Tol biopolymer transport system component